MEFTFIWLFLYYYNLRHHFNCISQTYTLLILTSRNYKDNVTDYIM